MLLVAENVGSLAFFSRKCLLSWLPLVSFSSVSWSQLSKRHCWEQRKSEWKFPLLPLIKNAPKSQAMAKHGLSLIMCRCCQQGKMRRSEERSVRKGGSRWDRKGEGGARWMNQCSVVPLAAYTNGLNCFQWPCSAQWCLYGVIDTHLYGWDVVWISGNLSECESRLDRLLFSRPCSQGL